MTGSKTMAQKTRILTKIKKFHKRHNSAISGQILASHNSSADWARELFKPSKDSWSLKKIL